MPKRLASTLARLVVASILVASLTPVASARAAAPTFPVIGLSDVSAAGASRSLYVPGEVIVRFKDGTSEFAIAAAHAKVGGTRKQPLGRGKGLDLASTGKRSVEDAVAAYEAMPEVAYAQPNYTYEAALAPNDPYFSSGYQWGLSNVGQMIDLGAGGSYTGTPDADIDAPEAWDVTIGSGSVIVAVVDSGVNYNHPDLAANMWRNPGEIAGNGVDDDSNGFIDDVYGRDFVNNDSAPMDDYFHGTHVAGIIAAVTNNSVGVAGVSWNAKVMALKTLRADGGGSTSTAIDAIAYAEAEGAQIMNVSWGGPAFDTALYNAMAAADMLFVCAAGNGDPTNNLGLNIDGTPSYYPAAFDLANIISVGATGLNDAPTSFSNYGPTRVDVFAPGLKVLSTYVDPGNPSAQYAYSDGTSMAAPHVAGVASLLLARDPSLTTAEMKNSILETVDVKPALSGKCVTGGRVNAWRAVTFLDAALSRIEQPDAARFTYTGSWSTWANAALSGGSYAYSAGPGSDVIVGFEGTRVALVARTGPEFGIASVSIDDGTPHDVSLYAPTSLYQQTVFTSPLLSPGPHTVRIAWTGRKAPAATGTYINIDAVDVPLVSAPAIVSPTPIDQSAPGVASAGAWNSWASPQLYGGTYLYANASGAATTFAFTGTQLDLIARTGPEFGIARVIVDGGEPRYVDLYSPVTLYQQRVFSTWPLSPAGPHTVRVEWTGRKNAASAGTYINVDRADIGGTPGVAAIRLEQADNARFTYTGSWGTWASPVLSGGSYAYSGAAGAGVIIGFEGTSVALLARTGPEFGIASVSVDGGVAQDINLYSAYTRYEKVVLLVPSLAAGPHAVSVVYTGRKDPASSGYYINVDGADITPASAPAIAAPVAIEQAGSSVSYAGAWSTWANASLSGGSYAYTAASAASATLTFTGTQLDLIARIGPEFGIARVVVDGGEPRYVDLYSPVTLYQQRVFSTWPLSPAGEHTVRVEWTGRKNAAASGTYVNIDRADTAP